MDTRKYTTYLTPGSSGQRKTNIAYSSHLGRASIPDTLCPFSLHPLPMDHPPALEYSQHHLKTAMLCLCKAFAHPLCFHLLTLPTWNILPDSSPTLTCPSLTHRPPLSSAFSGKSSSSVPALVPRPSSLPQFLPYVYCHYHTKNGFCCWLTCRYPPLACGLPL